MSRGNGEKSRGELRGDGDEDGDGDIHVASESQFSVRTAYWHPILFWLPSHLSYSG